MVQRHIDEGEPLDALRDEIAKWEIYPVYLRFGDTDLESRVTAVGAEEFCQMLRADMSFTGHKQGNDILPLLRESENYRPAVAVWEWRVVEFGSDGSDDECIYQMQIDYIPF